MCVKVCVRLVITERGGKRWREGERGVERYQERDGKRRAQRRKQRREGGGVSKEVMRERERKKKEMELNCLLASPQMIANARGRKT